jgi:hypothetical protein
MLVFNLLTILEQSHFWETFLVALPLGISKNVHQQYSIPLAGGLQGMQPFIAHPKYIQRQIVSSHHGIL